MKNLLWCLTAIPILSCSLVYAQDCKPLEELKNAAKEHHDSWVELKGDQFHLSQALYSFINKWKLPKGKSAILFSHKDDDDETTIILFVDGEQVCNTIKFPSQDKVTDFKAILKQIKEGESHVGWPL